MAEIKIEFAVNMPDEKSAKEVRNALIGLGEVDVNYEQGRVVLQTVIPWFLLQNKIEETGCKAVLVGFGGQSGVSIINTTGSNVDRTSLQGVIRFTSLQKDKAGVVIDGTIDGLSPGLHGLHVHETGDVSNGCNSVGDHYNPKNAQHGGPNDSIDRRHMGDLGNIRADNNGRATFRFTDSILNVCDIIGRSVVITEQPDDLGRGDNAQSLIDGNSGQRIACGVIARSAGIFENFKKICACDGVTLWDERSKVLRSKSKDANSII